MKGTGWGELYFKVKSQNLFFIIFQSKKEGSLLVFSGGESVQRRKTKIINKRNKWSLQVSI